MANFFLFWFVSNNHYDGFKVWKPSILPTLPTTTFLLHLKSFSLTEKNYACNNRNEKNFMICVSLCKKIVNYLCDDNKNKKVIILNQTTTTIIFLWLSLFHCVKYDHLMTNLMQNIILILIIIMWIVLLAEHGFRCTKNKTTKLPNITNKWLTSQDNQLHFFCLFVCFVSCFAA